MKLCLVFHCICRSYNEIPPYGQDLFVSLADLEVLLTKLSERGYQFTTLDGEGANTITLTFDDGYYNNLLFGELAHAYRIPYLIMVSTYYTMSGDCFPWFLEGGKYYNQMHQFDYYDLYTKTIAAKNLERPPVAIRPMNFQELEALANDELVEVGCHGYYHQALSKNFERYLGQERDLSRSAIQENLGQTPRYFAMANGIYTKRVTKELLTSFDRVLTSYGRPFRSGDNVVHRLNLANPNMAGPLIDQIDRHTGIARQIKRTLRTTRKLWL
jgi:peptidoglycan/xylan/chitin deacetylase (PgdA/CDA1 family)